MTVSTIAQHVAEVQEPQHERVRALDVLREKYARQYSVEKRYHFPEAGQRADIVHAIYYGRGEHEPKNPIIAASYDMFAQHLVQQFIMLSDEGFEFIAHEGAGEPYGNSYQMFQDIKRGRLVYLPTESTDSIRGDHPMLSETSCRDSSGEPIGLNEVFRCVHDVLAHSAGYGFNFSGEKGAWLVHRGTLPREAHLALWNETRGQNAWTNAGPHMRTVVRNKDSESANNDKIQGIDENIQQEARSLRILRRGEHGWKSLSDRPFPCQKCIIVPSSLV